MLTARLHLGFLLRLSGALIPLYAFMILTRTSQEAFISVLFLVYEGFIGYLKFKKSLSPPLFF